MTEAGLREIGEMYCNGNVQFDQRFLSIHKSDGSAGAAGDPGLKWGSGDSGGHHGGGF